MKPPKMVHVLLTCINSWGCKKELTPALAERLFREFHQVHKKLLLWSLFPEKDYLNK